MKRVNCYIYTRVSTAMQVDGYSLDAQREKLRRYAEFQNMQVAGEYTDEGKSGKNIEGRPEFCRMLEDVATGKDNVEYVLVFKLSRFGRNAADVLNSLQQMQDYGVNLICVEDGIDSSRDSGKLMISVLSAVAEIERENILVQTMEGRKQKAREGKWNGGFAPYGYKLENGELKIVEEEAVVIREIYDQYIHTTLGANGIAKHLNQKGFQKIQRQNGTLDTFSAHFVKLVLDNPVYAGKLAYGRRKNEKIQGSRNQYHVVKQEDYPVYEGIHEAIIPYEDWLAAQKKRKETGRKNEKVYSLDHQHILSGIVCCPGCGQPMYGCVNRKRKKDGSFYRDYWYYACKHRLELDGHPCDYKHQIHQEELNAAVEEVVLKIVQNPDFADAIRRRLDSALDTEALEAEVTAAQKQARQLRASKDRIAERMDHLDSSDPHYDQKYEDLEARLDKLYDEIAQAEAREAAAREKWEQIRQQKLSGEKVYDFLTLYGIIYQEMTDAQKREFMHCFIKRVEVYPEKQPDGRILKSIEFNFPVWLGEDFYAPGFPAEKVTPETVVLMSKVGVE